MTAVGICGSDLHTYLNGEIGGTVAESPLVLGHEAAGRVAALGPGLDGVFAIGQAVAMTRTALRYLRTMSERAPQPVYAPAFHWAVAA